MKYRLPNKTTIQRRERKTHDWETFVTTKDAYYEKHELCSLTSDSVFIRINDRKFDLLIVRRDNLI
jgi:hypothetical protein